MPSRALDDLTADFRIFANQVLATWLAKHPDDPLVVTFTLRTEAEQEAAFKAGRSEVQRHGTHEAHAPDGKSWAMDVAPKSVLGLPNWDPTNELWWELGEIVLSLGLRWGGCWEHPMPPVGKIPPWLFDPGHVEWRGVKHVSD